MEKISTESLELMERIEEALQNNWAIVAVPKKGIEELGIDAAYNLGITNIGSRGELELRNSWGTIVERPRLNFNREGIFQLNPSEVKKYIDYILIAEINDTETTSTVQSRHRKNFYSCYSLKVSKPFSGELSINQWERRLFPESAGYQYSAFRVIVEKKHMDEKN